MHSFSLLQGLYIKHSLTSANNSHDLIYKVISYWSYCCASDGRVRGGTIQYNTIAGGSQQCKCKQSKRQVALKMMSGSSSGSGSRNRSFNKQYLLPWSHVFPFQPGSQAHVKLPGLLMHVPSLWQGSWRHSITSIFKTKKRRMVKCRQLGENGTESTDTTTQSSRRKLSLTIWTLSQLRSLLI